MTNQQNDDLADLEDELEDEDVLEDEVDQEDESDDSEDDTDEEKERMRRALRKANKEAKERRLKAKELQDELDSLRESSLTAEEQTKRELELLRGQVEQQEADLREERIRNAASIALQDLKLQTVNAAATEDLHNILIGLVDEDTETTAAALKPILRKVLKQRSYLFAKARKVPDIDAKGGRKGEWELNDEELQELANKMGIRPT